MSPHIHYFPNRIILRDPNEFERLKRTEQCRLSLHFRARAGRISSRWNSFSKSNMRTSLNNSVKEFWRPQLFDCTSPEQQEALAKLRADEKTLFVHDTLRNQLEELLVSRRPSEKNKLTPHDRALLAKEFLGDRALEEYGTWVYYAWSRRLVHVMPEIEFRELRSNRNLFLITAEEQNILGAARIGIVGLSAGRAILNTLAREGIGREFRLADFDRLELSNMNRLEAGIHEIGELKVVLAARQLLEMNPYLQVEIFPEGLREGNLQAFFASEQRLDLVVEECDDLQMKVLAREFARRLKIPVLMSTSDRGLLDIERFDREPDRPILHGLLLQADANLLGSLSAKDKIPYVFDILDPDRMSERMLASLVEVEETISTWPQLSSAVTLGAALVTDAARRILLRQSVASGRFYVDLAELISDQKAWTPQPRRTQAKSIASVALAAENGSHQPRGADTDVSEKNLVKMLVEYATLAPSGGNSQPWRFVYRNKALECYTDRERSGIALDFDGYFSQLAIGAAVENICLAASSFGLSVHCELFPSGPQESLVCRVRWENVTGASRTDPLFDQIRKRVTNRLNGARKELSIDSLVALSSAAQAARAELRLVTTTPELQQVADLLGKVDRIVMLEPEFHADLMRELRWTPEDAERTRDGIDVRSLELSSVDRVALELIAKPRVVTAIRRLGGGGALGTMTKKWIGSASAAGLVVVSGNAHERYFQGGRALQRIWLQASSLGIAIQPITVITALHARVLYAPTSLSQRALELYRKILPEYFELFTLDDGLTDVFLFRLHLAGEPTVRALRRPLDEVLSFAS